jgi:RHS repeat-associated protein
MSRVKKALAWLVLACAAVGSVSATEVVTYLHTDKLGSVVMATDASGAPIWYERYYPYGERIGKTSLSFDNPLWYTGKPEETGLGLSYFGARWYDPITGRFQAVDPVGFFDENLKSFNQYIYANSNPYLYIDPDGRMALKDEKPGPEMGLVVRSGGGPGKRQSSIGPKNAPGIGRQRIQDTEVRPATSGVANELHRPYIRKGTRAEVEDRAPRTPDGRFIDSNTGAPIKGKYDLGHKPGNEFRREKARAESEGLSQKQFNDRMNNPNKYQIENPSSNRSHKFEKPGND